MVHCVEIDDVSTDGSVLAVVVGIGNCFVVQESSFVLRDLTDSTSSISVVSTEIRISDSGKVLS